MGKFNNPKVVSAPRPALNSVQATPEPAQHLMTEPLAAESVAIREIPEEQVGTIQRVGFIALCAYLLSGYANDFSMRLFHSNAYLSIVTEVLLPILLVASGAMFRALRLRAGKLWLFFFVWMVIDLPFSVWRTGTAMLLMSYGPRNWIELFYVAAFATSVASLRRLMNVQVVCSVLLVFSCLVFGSSGPDRFDIPHSLFFQNANELAMYLLFGMTVLMYPILRGSVIVRALAFIALGLSLVHVLKTGSRGGLLGAIALFIAVFILSRQRVVVFLMVATGALLATVFVSGHSLHRLTLAFTGTSLYDATTGDDLSAISSRLQRRELLMRSIVLSFEHPLFGVGPGQFPVAVDVESKKEGKHSPWLGTHNSFTQVSSECGFPAFFCYVAVLWFSVSASYKLFRRTQDRPQWRDVNAMSFCLLTSCVVYAVCTFFDHVAYTSLLPFMGGFCISMKLATDRSLGDAGPA